MCFAYLGKYTGRYHIYIASYVSNSELLPLHYILFVPEYTIHGYFYSYL